MVKRIIVCSDGTWNTPDQKDDGVIQPTNVVKMSRAILPQASDGTRQVVFYDPGVGTGNFLDKITGGAFGKGLSRNVQDAYRFISQNYSEGDKIYLFGFSRGAFTARSTAGLIRNCGILKKEHIDRLDDAYALYRNKNVHPDDAVSQQFRSNYSHEANAFFIGVWDTVGSLGVPVSALRWLTKKKYEFHDVTLSRSITYAYHALAIDEQRKPFKPTLWKIQHSDKQTVEQVWFAGVHSNIGGGYKDCGLSDYTFLWMKDKAEAAGLELDNDYIRQICQPNHHGVLRDSMTWYYRLLGKFRRKPGSDSLPSEFSHTSAVKRFEEKYQGYNPEGLAKFLDAHRDRVVTDDSGD